MVTVKTNKGDNVPPVFSTDQDIAGVATLEVPENTSGQNVGSPVDANDAVTESPTYELGGRDAGLFSIVRTTGQIRTRSSIESRGSAMRL